MMNWYGPFKDWYNTDTLCPVPDQQAAVSPPPDAVIEIAVSHLEIYHDMLLFEVMTKLISLPDGKVRARARTGGSVEVGLSPQLFADNAARFKSLFLPAARQAVERNLKTMNVLP